MFNIVERATPFKVIVGVIKLPDNVKLIALAAPVRFGLANGAFKFSAVCVNVEISLSKSVVLFTLLRPTIVAVMPATVPENVGLANDAFKFNAD